jgi:hypothetical protein
VDPPTRRPSVSIAAGRGSRPIAVIVRAVPVTPGGLAGEVEVVDTGDVFTFTDSADLVLHLLEVMAGDDA